MGSRKRGGGVKKPLHRYNAHKHWVELIFNPLHGAIEALQGNSLFPGARTVRSSGKILTIDPKHCRITRYARGIP